MRQVVSILSIVLLLLGSREQAAFADDPATRPSTQPAQQIVTLTEKAAKEIKAVAAAQNLPRYWLRVGVKANEDGKRFSYLLDITEDKPDPKVDNVFDSSGVTVAVSDKSAIYLMGTIIDFRDDDAGKGFVFRNPNAVKE
jgi:iron-sulfur cluster assembly accessory protein